VSSGTSQDCPTEPTFSIIPRQSDIEVSITANKKVSQDKGIIGADEALLTQALEMIKQEQYTEAVLILNSLLDSNEPSYAHIGLLTLGRLYAKTRLSEIKAKFEEVSQIEGDMRATALGLYAASYIVDGELQQAANLFVAIKDEYNGTDDAFYAQISLVDIYIQMNEYSLAEEELLTVNPTTEDQHKELLVYEAILAKEARINGYITETEFGSPDRYRPFEELSQGSPVMASRSAGAGLKNYPNPFNPITAVSFTLSEADHVLLIVYDLIGREIEVLVDEYKESGQHVAVFNAASYSSGSYLYRIVTSKGAYTGMMTVLK
jgi:hypothetical protein